MWNRAAGIIHGVYSGRADTVGSYASYPGTRKDEAESGEVQRLLLDGCLHTPVLGQRWEGNRGAETQGGGRGLRHLAGNLWFLWFSVDGLQLLLALA